MPAHARALRRPAAGPVRPAGPVAAAPARPPSNLLLWYLGLIPHWTGATPRLECRLLLRTHEWIVDRILDPRTTVAAAVSDLRPDGALERALTELVPPGEAERWRRFIQAVVANLERALLRPVTRRDEAWLRWLFLIPYGAHRGGAAAPRES
jgi:hypothetical protein